MTYRHLAFVTALAVLLLPAVGQAQTYTTAWGDPDLQGIWTNVTITPLQRPVDFAGQEVLTEEEAAAFEQVTAERRVDGPPRAGDPGTYNQHWFDRGTKVVGDRRTSLIIDTPDGRIPWRPDSPISAANRNEGRGVDYWDDHTDLDTGERCITDGMPHVPWVYNNNYQILQSPGYIAILHEQYNERRIITVDGSPHVEANIDQWFGDPRGHWEGDTLVVETTNYSPKASYRGSADGLHLIERFTLTGSDQLEYEITVTDPTTWTAPWTAMAPLSRSSDTLFEYACHEGNIGMAGILAGARVQEEKAAGR